MGKILYRYILKEILGPFALILCVFIFVLLMGRVLKMVEMIVRQGVSPWDLCRMILFLLPSFLPLAIPMGTLLAGVICFSRLSGDHEVIALKAAGISIYQLLPPVAIFAGFMTVASLLLTLYAAPWGAFSFRRMAFLLAKEHVSVAFKEGVFNEAFPGFVVYADRIHPHEGTMEGIFIHDQHSTEVPLQILARKGIFSTQNGQGEGLSLRLENGNIYQTSPKEGKVRRIHFQVYEINLDLTLSSIERKLRRTRKKELSTRYLARRITKLLGRGKPAGEYLTEMHRRLSIPMTCLLLGFLSLPLAFQTRPQGRSHGFLLGTMVILVYYLLFTVGETLAKTEQLPGWIAIWGPNILFGFSTIVLLVRTAREKPLRVLLMINALIDLTQGWVGRRFGAKG